MESKIRKFYHSPYLISLISVFSTMSASASNDKTISEAFTNNSSADYLISDSGSGNNRERIAYSDDTGFGWGGYNAELAAKGATIVMRDGVNDIRIKDKPAASANANRSQTYLYTLFSANAKTGDLTPTEFVDLSGANASITFETTTAAAGQSIRFTLRDSNDDWYVSSQSVNVSKNTTQTYDISGFSWSKVIPGAADDMNELDKGGELPLLSVTGDIAADFSSVTGGGFFIQQGFSAPTDELRVSSISWNGSEVTTAVPSAVNIRLEAENYNVVSDIDNNGVDDFSLNNRTDASGGAYMQAGRLQGSYLEYSINLPVDDVYQIAVRGTGVSSSTNSFRVSVNGGIDSVVHLSSTDSWDWSTVEDANSGLGPYSLLAGNNIVRVSLRERNAKIDQLKITNAAGGSLPAATLSQSNLNFGNQDVGSVSKAKTVTLTNTGNAPLNISGIAISEDFSQFNDCGDLLIEGATCQFVITFLPTSAGDISGELSITGDTAGGPDRIVLGGTSIAPAGVICGADAVGKNATYFSENFECSDWEKNYSTWGGTGPVRETGKAARSGTYGIKMSVATGDHWGGAIVFDHSKHGQTGNFNEIWTRYYVKFGANWGRDNPDQKVETVIGKAGYRARSDEVCSAPCLEMTDSNLLNLAGEIIGTSYWHRDMSESYFNKLEDRRFIFRKKIWSAPRQREQWYCVESHHILNTLGQKDGVYQNYLDGALVSDVRVARHRMSSIFDIDNSVLITYVGGGWVSDRDMVVYFDDWATSDRRIGCQK